MQKIIGRFISEQEEILIEKRINWLKMHHAREKDVLHDGRGEYIFQPPHLMDEDEPESGKFLKIYLPEDIKK